MEVLVGPTSKIETSSPPSQEKLKLVEPPASMFMKHEERSAEEKSNTTILINPVGFKGDYDGSDDSSKSSSSIGVPDDSDEEGEEEVSSDRVFDTLNSLQDSLNIKRGLSKYFNGKSKSFRDLSEVNCVREMKELEKQENPFNKRRRVLMANKYYFSKTKQHHKKKSTNFYSWSNPKSMPLLTLINEDGSDDHEKLSQQNPSSEILQHHAEQEDGSKFKVGFRPYKCWLDLDELQEYINE